MGTGRNQQTVEEMPSAAVWQTPPALSNNNQNYTPGEPENSSKLLMLNPAKMGRPLKFIFTILIVIISLSIKAGLLTNNTNSNNTGATPSVMQTYTPLNPDELVFGPQVSTQTQTWIKDFVNEINNYNQNSVDILNKYATMEANDTLYSSNFKNVWQTDKPTLLTDQQNLTALAQKAPEAGLDNKQQKLINRIVFLYGEEIAARDAMSNAVEHRNTTDLQGALNYMQQVETERVELLGQLGATIS